MFKHSLILIFVSYPLPQKTVKIVGSRFVSVVLKKANDTNTDSLGRHSFDNLVLREYRSALKSVG